MSRAAPFALLLLALPGLALAQPTVREAARRRAMLEGRAPNPALLGYDGVVRRTKFAGGDPMFIGGMALSELATGAGRGDADAHGDVAYALSTPELYASTAVFHATFSGSNAALEAGGRLLAVRAPGLVPGGKLADLAKTNLVLTAALTTTQLVEIDFGGFTFKDALDADLTKLKHARVGLRDVPPEDLLITAGSVAASIPVWAGAKQAAVFAGKRLAARVAVTAGAQAATIWIPVGGQVFNAAVAAGHVVWFAVDLAGLILVSHAIEGQVKGYKNHRAARDGVLAAIRDLNRVAAEDDGRPDPEALDAALRRVQLAYRDVRAYRYEAVLEEDARLAQRLIRWGTPEDAIKQLSMAAVSEYGSDLADVATTALLKRTTDTMRADPSVTLPGRDRRALLRSLENYRRQVRRDLRRIYEADRLPEPALLTGLRTRKTRRGTRTIGRPFQLPEHQLQIYDQEALVYARVAARLNDPALRTKLEGERALVLELRDLDGALAAEAMRDDDPVAAHTARAEAAARAEALRAAAIAPLLPEAGQPAEFRLPTAADIPDLGSHDGINQLLDQTLGDE